MNGLLKITNDDCRFIHLNDNLIQNYANFRKLKTELNYIFVYIFVSESAKGPSGSDSAHKNDLIFTLYLHL